MAIVWLVLAIVGSTFACGSAPTAQDIADDAVFTASDLPLGWTASPLPARDNVENVMEECGAEAPAEVADDGDPRAFGNWQPASEDGFVGSRVEVNSDATQAEAILSELRTPAGQACFAESLAAAFKSPGVEVGDFSFEEREPAGVGDDSVVLRAEVPLSGNNFDVVWFSDLVVVQQGRALIELAFGNLHKPMVSADVQKLTGVVLERIPSDL